MNTMNRWAWVCPWLAIALAVFVLVWWGLSWWTALLAALLLVCPALILWGLFTVRSSPMAEPLPQTDGMTMNWAAPFYDLYCPLIGFGPAFRARTLAQAAIRPGERILDVGCGTGVLTRMALAAAEPGGAAVGIDPSWKMIAVGRQRAARLGSGAEFKLAAIEALPFPDAAFDLALSSLMLHHLPPGTKDRGLAEVYRVLRPGGRFVAVDIGHPSNPLWWLLLWPLTMMSSVADNLRGRVPEHLRRAGFGQIEIRGRCAGLLVFWHAVKPTAEGGAS